MTELIFTIKTAINNLIRFCNEKADQPLWPNGPTGSDYLRGLVRVDEDGVNRGSFVEELTTLDKTVSYLLSLDWEEVFPPASAVKEGCRYFRASAYKRSNFAWTGIMTLEQARQLYPVGVVEGDHGDELVAWMVENDDDDIPFSTTEDIHFIMEGDMMATWYPGPITPPIPEDFDLHAEDDWDPSWPVKLRMPPK